MVRLIPLILLFSLSAQADFLGLGEDTGLQSRIPALIEELRSLEMKVDPNYEDAFNKGVRKIENGMEEEKLYCTGEASDAEGKTLPKDKKQLCMRALKKHYLQAMDSIYELKKKYLELIHSRQMKRMDEVHEKLKVDLEKNF
jgi:hypothetical protein